ncbi:MAG: S8 family serine peptidase [Actinomycetota bacterium]
MRISALTTIVALAVASPAGAATDPYIDRQWGLARIGAPEAWSVGKGDGATIAIVDTGVDRSHVDLKGNIVPGYDFVDGDSDPSDENGHGTHVAGIAAAVAGNGHGVAGVAPEAKIMPIRVLDADGYGYASDIDEGVRWAVAHGADVVNMSLGDNVVVENLMGGTLADTVDYAWSKGVVPVISAGNDEFFRTELRAAKTLLVTATTRTDAKASYATSVGFAPWGIAAPGGDNSEGIEDTVFSTYWSTSKPNAYGWGQGTSMAAPHVAGGAAVLRGLGLSPQATVDRLLDTAKDIGASGDDFTFGHGRVDVAAAIAGLKKPSVDAPKVGSKNEGTTDDDNNDTASDGRSNEPRATADGDEAEPSSKPAADAQLSPSPSPPVRAAVADEPDGSNAVPYVFFGGLFATATGALIALRRLRMAR